jgi:hypothetical protein
MRLAMPTAATTTNSLQDEGLSDTLTTHEAEVIAPMQFSADAVSASQTGIIVGADAGRGVPRTPAPPRRLGGQGSSVPSNRGILLLPNESQIPAARRLVVLVPDVEVDESGLAARIWGLASPRRLEVLLLGTARREQEQYRARRRLVTMAAITRDDSVHVDIELALDQGWLPAVRHVWRPGDLVVCHDEQRLTAGLGRHPLAQVLLRRVATPVYVVSGFYPELPDERVRGVAQLGSWLPPAVIIALFFGLQARLTRATTGSLQTILFLLTVLIEFALIAAWERFLSNLK